MFLFSFSLIAILVACNTANQCTKIVDDQCFTLIDDAKFKEKMEDKQDNGTVYKYYYNKAKELCKDQGAEVLQVDMNNKKDAKQIAVESILQESDIIPINCDYEFKANETEPVILKCDERWTSSVRDKYPTFNKTSEISNKTTSPISYVPLDAEFTKEQFKPYKLICQGPVGNTTIKSTTTPTSAAVVIGEVKILIAAMSLIVMNF